MSSSSIPSTDKQLYAVYQAGPEAHEQLFLFSLEEDAKTYLALSKEAHEGKYDDLYIETVNVDDIAHFMRAGLFAYRVDLVIEDASVYRIYAWKHGFYGKGDINILETGYGSLLRSQGDSRPMFCINVIAKSRDNAAEIAREKMAEYFADKK